MRLPTLKKKVLAIALASGVALGVGGMAAAYLEASGSGTGTATLGTVKTFNVTLYNGTGTTLAPGKPAYLTFSVQNVGTSKERVYTATVNVERTGTDVVTSNTVKKVTGCLASWFIANLTRWEVDSTGYWYSLTSGKTTYSTSKRVFTGTPKTEHVHTYKLVTATLIHLKVLHITVLEKMITTPHTTQGKCEGHLPIVTVTVHH